VSDNGLFAPLRELESYNQISALLKNTAHKTALCTGVVDSQKCHLSWALSHEHNRPLLFITHSELKAREVFEDLQFFMPGTVKYYPVRDMIFYAADVRSADILKQRTSVIDALLCGTPTAVVLSVEALFDRLTAPERFKEFILRCRAGDVLRIDDLTARLVRMGYERTELVEGPGQFAVRGGIIDVFTTLYENAIRIELWGDEIDSIRLMDPISQRSIENCADISIFPMRELVYDQTDVDRAIAAITKEYKTTIDRYTKAGLKDELETLQSTMTHVLERLRESRGFSGVDQYAPYFYPTASTLLDYLPTETILIFDEPTRIAQHAENVSGEFAESIKNRIAKGYLLPGQAELILPYEEVLQRTESFSRVLLSTFASTVRDFTINAMAAFSVKSSGIIQKRVDLLEEELRYYMEQNYRVLILAGGRTRAERLCDELTQRGLTTKTVEDIGATTLARGTIQLSRGSLNKGFDYPLIGLAVISGKELFDGAKKKRVRKRKKGAEINSFAELRVGDYVVHDNHGVGIYQGIEKIIVDNVGKDYLKINYKDGGNLYVATSQLDMLQKYIGGEDAKPKLNKLGGAEWGRAKSRVRGAVQILAKDLAALYAQREAAVGHPYGADTIWQTEFEEQFPHDETDDQIAAIEDVKRDMESARVMDRLVCGDVGYGKTEIAIRAAFKAVQDNKQVAYLVPTTILAQQHFNTFTQRMKDYPVNISMLSRFRTPKQQRETLEGLQKGAIDIVIGTHRLLSSDLQFKNLGLIVVDEEQRFGVAHKEKLKRIRENIDVLTLTATPIPRTLHMSLTGIRDMSILEEPPQERQPVQTYVMEYNPELVRDAIHREIARDGQVYYLHNRVRNIAETAARIQQLVPDANVSFAHGQMSEHELENIMIDFIAGDIDVLVCTTIIETGLDIANVNTIIIQDSDYMGLAQLYQLRGRVGRSSRSSYAYLMYRRDKILTEASEKRLQTIREFTEFGSGFKIAMRDLEIRGAGNMLGAEQHGHMDSVGYDMYCKLLNEAVREQRGETVETEFETLIDISVNAFIPDSFVGNELQKLEVYKRIAALQTAQDFNDVQEEIEDRFGTLPQAVQTLLDIALLKATAHRAYVTAITQRNDAYAITFKGDAPIDPAQIAALVQAHPKTLRFIVAQSPLLTFRPPADAPNNLLTMRKMLETLTAE